MKEELEYYKKLGKLCSLLDFLEQSYYNDKGRDMCGTSGGSVLLSSVNNINTIPQKVSNLSKKYRFKGKNGIGIAIRKRIDNIVKECNTATKSINGYTYLYIVWLSYFEMNEKNERRNDE